MSYIPPNAGNLVRADSRQLRARAFDQFKDLCEDACFYGVIQAAFWLRRKIQNVISVPGFGVPSKADGESPPHLQTGKLHDSIKVLIGNDKTAMVYTDTPYWYYLEYGTRNSDGSVRMVKRPFWRTTIANEQENMSRVAIAGIKHYMTTKRLHGSDLINSQDTYFDGNYF